MVFLKKFPTTLTRVRSLPPSHAHSANNVFVLFIFLNVQLLRSHHRKSCNDPIISEGFHPVVLFLKHCISNETATLSANFSSPCISWRSRPMILSVCRLTLLSSPCPISFRILSLKREEGRFFMFSSLLITDALVHHIWKASWS